MEIGSVVEYAGASAPAGYLICDGTSYAVATHPDLHAVIGDTFGGDGGTNFSVPDRRGRVSVGAGSGSGLTTRAVGDTGGAESTTDVPAHSHGLGDNCADDDGNNSSAVGNYPAEGESNQYSDEADEKMGNEATESTGVAAVDIMNPFLALNFIIKT